MSVLLSVGGQKHLWSLKALVIGLCTSFIVFAILRPGPNTEIRSERDEPQFLGSHLFLWGKM